MNLDLIRIGQIAITVADTDRAERFYEQALAFESSTASATSSSSIAPGVRLMIGRSDDPAEVARASTLYFRCADPRLLLSAN
jgi:predicted enzyme related to lactoylglutathione lyase